MVFADTSGLRNLYQIVRCGTAALAAFLGVGTAPLSHAPQRSFIRVSHSPSDAQRGDSKGDGRRTRQERRGAGHSCGRHEREHGLAGAVWGPR